MTENNRGVRQKKVVSKKNQGLRHREEVEAGTLLLGNDKNNVIVNIYLLSYFLC